VKNHGSQPLILQFASQIESIQLIPAFFDPIPLHLFLAFIQVAKMATQPPVGTPKQGMPPTTSNMPRASAPPSAGSSAAPRPGGSAPSANTADYRILTRQKLAELAKQIDGEDRLDEDAARIMMLLADEFVDSVTNFACKLAKHRKSPTVEVKDVQMHLERNWGIRIAGVSADDFLPPSRGRKRPLETHKQRLHNIKKFKYR
jgi:transcription initiation factor TFIID subunit 12